MKAITQLFIVLIVISSNLICKGQGKKELPNILFFITDDQSQVDVSIYGSPDAKTPHISKLAVLGMTFQNAYVASPSCAPSRAALLTGLMPARNGAEANHTYPKPDIPFLTTNLQKVGYKIAAFGKWNLYDAGTKVPFIAVWPKHIPAQSKTNALISWVDIFPTLIDIGGGESNEGIDGDSFKEVLVGKSETHRTFLFTTHSGDGRMNTFPIRAVTDGRYKYILNLYPENYHYNHSDILRKPWAGAYWDSWSALEDKDPKAAAIIQRYYVRPLEEFFDLQNDPYELKNLLISESHQKIISKFRTLVHDWMLQQEDKKTIFGTPTSIDKPRPDKSMFPTH